MKTSENIWIFVIQHENFNTRLIYVNESNREEATRKAKIETLKDLKPFNSDEKLLEMFHEMEYYFHFEKLMITGGVIKEFR